ncbi:MAG: mannose-6-phosphate isomerase [Clostridiales bacterium]|nr:mannose-6-phosphate isomerase [Clostridiales bacterium]
MKAIYHMEPVLESFIWGGRKIIDKFHLKTDLENVGIMYHVIAIPGKLDCRIKETGECLSDFYQRHRELFGCRSRYFPVRMTTSCGEDKMSYHLHPGDDYAFAHEGTRGKMTGSVAMEESDRVNEILFGNKAQTLDEFKQMVEAENWEDLFGTIHQKEGDFLHTPAGVIHGGGGGGKMTMTFSTNSDITYRFYDYGRNDPSRHLHLKQVYDCVNIPEVPLATIHPKPIERDGIRIYDFYDKEGEYTAQRLDIHGEGSYERKEFYFLFCSEGGGIAGNTTIDSGETVFVPAQWGRLSLEGNMRLYLISYRDKCQERTKDDRD